MARVDATRRAIVASIVVFGPPRAGKSAVLRAIHDRVPPARRGALPPLGAESAHAPFLDWLPLDLGTIAGWHVKVHLYAIAGQASFDSTRRLLLGDADGVLFVADSQAARLDENLAALRVLEEQLLDRDGDRRDVPRVFCYTKQDLPRELILPAATLDEALNFRGAPSSGADALRATGVLEALHRLVAMVMRRLTSTPATGA
ncbi:MAG TPA: hypothetical protein VFN90_02165 [Gemmatimonadales bacterium]|nr:hypothetical protein [Gemmatimonadales bacterium]